MPPVLRSVLAIIGGFITLSFVVGLLNAITGSMLHLTSSTMTPTYLGLNVLFRLLAALAAGLVAALIAGRRPLEHAGVLAAISLAAAAVSYRLLAGHYPGWYLRTLLLVPPVLMLLGALIVERKEASLKSV